MSPLRYLAERVGAVVVGLIALALGAYFLFMCASVVFPGLAVYGWQGARCDVESVAIHGDGGQRWLSISYHYSWNGREFAGDRLATRRRVYYDDGRTGAALHEVQPGATVDCYVNPRRPIEAIIHRDPWWIVLMVASGIPFGVLLIGAGVILLLPERFNPCTSASVETRDAH